MRFRSDVTAALSAHGALLLGEMHDNPAHHLLQAAAVTEFAVSGSKNAPAIVFEQIRDDQQAGLDRFADFNRNATRLATVGDLKRFLDWDKSGWPKDIYDPLFKAVIADKLAIYPGDVPRAAIMKTAKKGESSLPAAERTRLGLDSPLGARLDAASHQGYRGLPLRRDAEVGIRRHGVRPALSRRASGRRRVEGVRSTWRSLSDRRH